MGASLIQQCSHLQPLAAALAPRRHKPTTSDRYISVTEEVIDMLAHYSRPSRTRREAAARNDRIALVAVLVLMAGFLGTSALLLH